MIGDAVSRLTAKAANATFPPKTQPVTARSLNDPIPPKAPTIPIWADHGIALPEGELTSIYGDSNVGKTTLAANIASLTMQQGRRVVYVALERPAHVLRLLKELTPERHWNEARVLDGWNEQAFADQAEWAGETGLIIVDHLTNVLAALDLSANQDLSPAIVDGLLVNAFGNATRLWLDHTGWPQGKQGRESAGETPRGSRAKLDIPAVAYRYYLNGRHRILTTDPPAKWKDDYGDQPTPIRLQFTDQGHQLYATEANITSQPVDTAQVINAALDVLGKWEPADLHRLMLQHPKYEKLSADKKPTQRRAKRWAETHGWRLISGHNQPPVYAR